MKIVKLPSWSLFFSLFCHSIAFASGTDFGISPQRAAQFAPYSMMSSNAYHRVDRQKFDLEKLGWILVDKLGQVSALPTESRRSGLAYDIFENRRSNEVVFAFRGSDSKRDYVTANLALWPVQYREAKKALSDYIEQHPDKKLMLTGHSLGGSLALSMSVQYGIDAIVFDSSPRIFDGLGDHHLPAKRFMIFEHGEVLSFLRKFSKKIFRIIPAENIFEVNFDFEGENRHRSDYLAQALLGLGASIDTALSAVRTAPDKKIISPSNSLERIQRADGQDVNVQVYAAASTANMACRGIAIISHGAGGSEKGYAYLGEAMARLGYLGLVVGHRESGLDALKENIRQQRGLQAGLAALVVKGDAYRARMADIVATRAWGETHCAGKEAILLGHSMGAATVMMAAGAKNLLGVQPPPTFDLYIALSPQGVGAIFPPNAWQGVKAPVLSMTGTLDKELGGQSWESRLQPFQNMSAHCQWQGIVEGATHMHFAGNGMPPKTEALVTATIADFIDQVRQARCTPAPVRDGMTLEAR